MRAGLSVKCLHDLKTSSRKKNVYVSDMIILPLWETGPWQGIAHLLALANANVGETSKRKKNQCGKW